MPVRRFRSVDEMDGNTWYDRNDPRLFRAIQTTWDFAQRLTQPRFPPGVHKHRSVEEAEAFHERRQG